MQKNKTLILVVVLILIIVGVGFTVVRPWFQSRTVPVTVMEVIERPELNFSFTFPSGEDAYSYLEPQFDATATSGPRAGFIMLPTDDYQTYQADGFVGEAPPSISIFVYEEKEEPLPPGVTSTPSVDRMVKIRTWAEANSGITSYNLAQTPPEEVTLMARRQFTLRLMDSIHRTCTSCSIKITFTSSRGSTMGKPIHSTKRFRILFNRCCFCRK